MDEETEGKVDPAIEREALSMGWFPKDKFRGNPAKWTDAETYVRKGKELMPLLRATNAKQAGELARLSTQVEELRGALSESAEAMENFRKYHEETALRAYEKARKDLLNSKKQALAALKDGEGDPAAVVELDEAIATLDAAKPTITEPKKKEEKKPEPSAGAVHPDYPAWEAENKHWLVDTNKAAYASSMAQFLRTQHPNVVGRAFLDLVTEAVEEKFGGASAKSLEGGTRNPGGRGSGGGQTYADLPAEAKAACDKMAARLVGPNKMYKDEKAWRAAYCKDYDWS